MKKIIFCLIASVVSLSTFSQMQVKEYNFSSFRTQEKKVTPVLDAKSSAEAKKHPEYGILPFNAPCYNCAELIDERTADSRLFIAPNDSTHTWSQQSYFPIHYKKFAKDVWHTIDQRLRPDSANPGVYVAKNQPVPTKLDLNKKNASLDLGEMEFSFSNNLTMYFFEEGKAYTRTEKGNYSNATVGEEGLKVYNLWNGIDLSQAFTVGQVETNYIINSPLDVPVSDSGYMVIEDHFSIPDGYTFEEENPNPNNTEKYYRSDYVLKDKKGDVLLYYEKPIYTDANSFGMMGYYNLERDGNNYTLQIMVPVAWLKNPDNAYPIVIDPVIEGSTKVGNYRKTTDPSASQGFTTYTVGQGYCPYNMTVRVPGKSSLTNTYVQVEWQLTFDNTCQASPPAPSDMCTYTQVWQTVVCDSCHTSEVISCERSFSTNYIGTCTTDPNLVPGADSIPIITTPPFLFCYAPQCADYNINLTLENSDSVCNESCNYLCARGNLWEVTIEAQQVQVSIVQNTNKVCAGQPIVDTAHAIYGVPPYTYEWFVGTDSGVTTTDSIYVVAPEQSLSVYALAIDNCGVISPPSNTLQDNVVPAPPADAGPDQKLCDGGATVTLGGNPTTSGATVTWVGSNDTVQGWLSNDTAFNPTVTVPPGTIDTFFYVLTATYPPPGCFRTDTVYVNSGADPLPVIDSSGPTTFCPGQSVTLSVVGNYASYLWNNGGTGPSITVGAAGNYQLSVKDGNGCPGTSNTIPVNLTSIPPFNVFPDTTIIYGDSVMLYTNANLGSSSVDSFTWYPNVYISCLSCDNPEVAPLNNQYYGLIIYSGGCSASDSALIQIIFPDNFFIPNAFTPNNDGIDDNFYIAAQSGVQVDLFQVFDRWGEKVHDGPYPWNGQYKGKDEPEGVYVYLFKLTLYGLNQPVFRKGSVTLLR